MGEFEYVDAVRHNTNLLIGYAGATGTGKTWSALETAVGLAPSGRIGLLDTEAGRATHYADRFKFKHLDLRPPFTPQRFLTAIRSAEAAQFEVLVIDSASDEYEGEGGLQEMHDNAIVRMAKKTSLDEIEGWEYDKYNAPAWSSPKTMHKRVLMNPLRQLRMHLIFCLRAEDKIEFTKEKYIKDGKDREKMAIKPRGWVPICEKRFMFDMTISCVFSPDAPGVPMMTETGLALNGKIQEQHRHAFPQGKQITAETGRLLAEWAQGGATTVKRGQGGLSLDERAAKAAERIRAGQNKPAVEKAYGLAVGLIAELEAAGKVPLLDALKQARDERLQEFDPPAKSRDDLLTEIMLAGTAAFGKSVSKAEVEISVATNGKCATIADLQAKGTDEQLNAVLAHFEALKGC